MLQLHLHCTHPDNQHQEVPADDRGDKVASNYIQLMHLGAFGLRKFKTRCVSTNTDYNTQIITLTRRFMFTSVHMYMKRESDNDILYQYLTASYLTFTAGRQMLRRLVSG